MSASARIQLALLTMVSLLLTVRPVDANPQLLKFFQVPSGLYLGQPAPEVTSVLGRQRATITAKEKQGEIESWTVQGLFISRLNSAQFHFYQGQLQEIELRYGKDQWSAKKFERHFKDYRAMLVHKYGQPRVNRDTAENGGVKQFTYACTWEAPGAIVRLVYFSAEQGQNVYREVSAHVSRTTARLVAAAEAPAESESASSGSTGETASYQDYPDVDVNLPVDPEVPAMPELEMPAPGNLFDEATMAAEEIAQMESAAEIAAVQGQGGALDGEQNIHHRPVTQRAKVTAAKKDED